MRSVDGVGSTVNGVYGYPAGSGYATTVLPALAANSTYHGTVTYPIPADMKPGEAMEALVRQLSKSPTNADFLARIAISQKAK